MLSPAKIALAALLAALLTLTGCATPEQSALAETRREAVEADIDSIMTIELDPSEYGEAKRCLLDSDYRNHRALGDRHILFEGRGDRQWINTLRARCRDLDKDYIFITKSANSGGKMCRLDQFQLADRLDATWNNLGTGPTCILGEFKPVTAEQVREIEMLLDSL
jgi:hypothetical protein